MFWRVTERQIVERQGFLRAVLLVNRMGQQKRCFARCG